MKIIHLVNYFQHQLGYQEFYIAKEQAKQGHEVLVLTSNRYFPFYDYQNTVQNILGPRKFGAGRKKINGFTIEYLPALFEQPGRRIWLKGLKKRIKSFKPDLIHVHGEYTLLSLQSVLWKKRLKYRLVIDSHSHPRNLGPDKNGLFFFLKKIMSFLVIRIYKKFIFDRKDIKWVATTEWNKKYLVERFAFSSEDLVLIPNGADTEIFYPDKGVRSQKRKELNLNENDVVILYTGMISKNKGLDKIIKASKDFAEELHLKYVFVGGIEKKFHKNFIELIKGLEDLVILSHAAFNKDLPAYYQMADIACWPMESSLSAVDAMASGLPIIICDKLSERLKNGNGIGIEEGNVQQLKDALYKLASDRALRTAMGNRSLELVKKELNWTCISQRFIDIAFS